MSRQNGNRSLNSRPTVVLGADPDADDYPGEELEHVYVSQEHSTVSLCYAMLRPFSGV